MEECTECWHALGVNMQDATVHMVPQCCCGYGVVLQVWMNTECEFELALKRRYGCAMHAADVLQERVGTAYTGHL